MKERGRIGADGPSGCFAHHVLSIPREVGTDLVPGLAFVRGSEDVLRGGVEHAGIVRREEYRERVVETVFHVFGRRSEHPLGPNADLWSLPGLPVKRTVLDLSFA